VHGIDPALTLCGAGSMELIGMLIRAFCGPGTEVLASKHSYAFFRTAALACGAGYIAAHEADRTVSVDALLAAVTPTTRVVCVANPGNPTGSRIPRRELLRLRDKLPDHVLLLIDEAYGEFADTPSEAMWDLVERGDTVVMRTFSKAYGLAGLRVGWGLFPSDIGIEVRKLLNPNNISGPAQAAATAAMKDQTHMRATVAETARRRTAFIAKLHARGFDAEDSHTNFILIDLGTPDAASSASDALRQEGIILRAMGGYGLGHCLRATIGAQSDMALAAEILGRWRHG
ncbi:MAG: histidinol-phosphate transaminase, partial [Paracoccaceae bacterium]